MRVKVSGYSHTGLIVTLEANVPLGRRSGPVIRRLMSEARSLHLDPIKPAPDPVTPAPEPDKPGKGPKK